MSGMMSIVPTNKRLSAMDNVVVDYFVGIEDAAATRTTTTVGGFVIVRLSLLCRCGGSGYDGPAALLRSSPRSQSWQPEELVPAEYL